MTEQPDGAALLTELLEAWRRYHETDPSLAPVLDVDTALDIVAVAREGDDPDTVR